jgi:hypothetical protein
MGAACATLTQDSRPKARNALRSDNMIDVLSEIYVSQVKQYISQCHSAYPQHAVYIMFLEIQANMLRTFSVRNVKYSDITQ